MRRPLQFAEPARRPIAAPLSEVARVLGDDLARVRTAARKVAPYITATGEKIWSLYLIEKELHPGRFRRRSGGIIGRRSGRPPVLGN
jgi:hypothetical protein